MRVFKLKNIKFSIILKFFNIYRFCLTCVHFERLKILIVPIVRKERREISNKNTLISYIYNCNVFLFIL